MADTNKTTAKNPDTTAPEKRDGAAENPQRADQNNKDIERAEQAAEESESKEPGGVTETQDAKTDVVSGLRGHDVGDHYAQRFANAPANPKLAPRVDPDLPDDQKVRMEITDSDNPDPANPKVTYVPEVMVGDYLRAGWRRPDA